jgi:hypothetical protein
VTGWSWALGTQAPGEAPSGPAPQGSAPRPCDYLTIPLSQAAYALKEFQTPVQPLHPTPLAGNRGGGLGTYRPLITCSGPLRVPKVQTWYVCHVFARVGLHARATPVPGLLLACTQLSNFCPNSVVCNTNSRSPQIRLFNPGTPQPIVQVLNRSLIT